MAPRTAKAKKPTNAKVADNEAPKKGRGKAKSAEEPELDIAENEVGDVAPVIEKKSSTRGKKATNGDTNGLEETNEVVEVPPSKKSKKNKIADTPSEEKEANDDINVAKEEVANADEEDIESNGHTDEPAGKTGKGRKKPTKKESAPIKAKTETKSSARGKKNAKPETDSEVLEKDEESDEKPKAAPKGKGRKATKKVEKEVEPEVPEEQNESGEEDIKAEAPSKGKKRGPAKAAKEPTPENEGEEDAEEEEPTKENKKKEKKGKKNQGKKGTGKQTGVDEDEVIPASKKRRFVEKEDEVKHEELTEETVSEPKPAKGKRGAKKAAEAAVTTEEAPEAGDSNRRRRKAGDEKVPDDTKQKAPPKNKATTDYENIDFSNTSKNAQGKEWNLKIASWNVDGIRAWMSKGGLDYIKYEKPDILCLQETKCAKDKLPDEIANLPGYHAYWQGSDKDGYAGVGIYTTKLAMNVQYGLENEELDNEGRIITAEYEQFYLICTYVPNAGRKLVTLPKRLTWNEEFRRHVKALNEKKPVIICGDMNVAHNEIDLSNPKSNKKNAGFTAEERAGMTELLSDGFVDTYRHLKPQETGAYTFWTYMMNSRAKNVGWRLDYFLMSERLLPSLCDNVIRSEVYGSDHCPITLFLHITSADKPKE